MSHTVFKYFNLIQKRTAPNSEYAVTPSAPPKLPLVASSRRQLRIFAERCGQLLNAQGLSFLPGGSLLRDPANPLGLHMPVPGFVF